MSHYTCLVLTENGTLEEVERLLAPYDENKTVPEYKSFHDEASVKRMSEYYKETDLEKLAAKMSEWAGGEGGIEGDKLYHLTTYNPMSKWDWYAIGGRWDGVIKNNKERVADIPDDFECYSIITPDGSWHSRGKMGWWAVSMDEEKEWPAIKASIVKDYPDAIAVLCDLHI